MPWITIGGAIAGQVVGGMLSDGSSASPSGGQASAYVPINRPGFDQNFQDYFGQYSNQLNSSQGFTSPFAQSSFSQQINNPNAQWFRHGADLAGSDYGYQAGMARQGSQGLYGAGDRFGQMAFDPRGSQYQMAVGQLQDNTRAAEYARGIGMTPYGAAVEGNVMGQFQNDWQNQQLQRAQMGLQGMGRAYEGASALGNVGAQMQMAAGQTPYDAVNTIANNQNQAIGNYWATQQPYMQGLNQLQSNSLGYLNNANSAANQAFGQNMQNNNQAMQYGQAVSGPITQAIKGFGNIWGNQTQPYDPSTQSGGWSGTSNAGFYYGTGGSGD